MDYKSTLSLSYEEFSDIVGQERSEVDELYLLVDIEELYPDMEKGIREYKIVVERLEDNKFFEFEYSESHQNPQNILIYWICVPVIFFSLVEFFFCITI